MAVIERIVKIASNPEHSLKIVQLIFGIFVLAFSCGWQSKGITYTDLNADDYNEEGKIFFTVFIGIFAMLYLAGILIHLCLNYPKTLSPFLDICSSSFLFIMTLISFILLESAVSNLANSLAVKEADLSLGVLSAAVVFSLVLCILFAVGCIFAIWTYRSHQSEYSFSDSRTMSDLPDDIPT